MRDIWEKLVGAVMAVAIVGGMLGGLVLSLESGKPVMDREAAQPPASGESESAAVHVPSTPVATLDQLRAGCADEVRRRTQLSQPSLCSQYADRFRAERPVERAEPTAVASRSREPPAHEEPQRATGEEMLLASAERTCRPLGYGTIKYRDCRANVSRDLSRQCTELKAKRERASWHTGDYDRLVEQTQLTCYAADHYKIID